MASSWEKAMVILILAMLFLLAYLLSMSSEEFSKGSSAGFAILDDAAESIKKLISHNLRDNENKMGERIEKENIELVKNAWGENFENISSNELEKNNTETDGQKMGQENATESVSLTSSSSTTLTSSSTSTTFSGKRCESPSDCDRDVKRMVCRGNVVYETVTSYSCRNPGTPYSLCVGRVRESAVKSCEDYERCNDGVCARIYLNECDMLCDIGGYDIFYCSDECHGNDTIIEPRKWCSDDYRYCCCKR